MYSTTSRPVPGYVLKNRRTTLERAEKFISTTEWTDCNLYGCLYPKKFPLTKLTHYSNEKRISYGEAIAGEYKLANVGESYGPTWSTHWFRLEYKIPTEWQNDEIFLNWNSNSEALVWKDDEPLQGLTSEHDRTRFPLPYASNSQVLYIEMACNTLFGAGDNGLISPPDLQRQFKLTAAQLITRDHCVYQLLMDIQVMLDLIKSWGPDSSYFYQALYTLNDIINCCQGNINEESLKKGHGMAVQFFSQANGACQHTLHAIANCHIDSAWLWPYAETIRKCARSWSSTVNLLEKYTNFKFAISQAQQLEWVQQKYPKLFAKIRKYVATGRILPVGGSWVEMDGNIPSGESFARQFLLGQHYFKENFGFFCTEFWLPDTFGYSAQLPQIMKLAGMKHFVTQKISWNLVNKFPHHTFHWLGLDGTSVLTHFPPGDNYGMEGRAKELLYSQSNSQDKGRTNDGLYLFGHGDGGQGPSEDILERLSRLKDVDGCPKLVHSTVAQFFGETEGTCKGKLCRWRGELYLELHNGTYTTQAKTKQGNRRGEQLLYNAELLASIAKNVSRTEYPEQALQHLWKLLLLNQFHDVLPGSSIAEVYEDAERYYQEIMQKGAAILDDGLKQVTASTARAKENGWFNTLSWSRKAVVPSPVGDAPFLCAIQVQGIGMSPMEQAKIGDISPVSITKKNSGFILQNSHLTIHLDWLGRIVESYAAGSCKNTAIPNQPSNQFVVFDDVPLFWDAWDVMDYHLETRKVVTDVLKPLNVIEKEPLKVSLKIVLRISERSTVEQVISLDAVSPFVKFSNRVEWNEGHKFLKVEFPCNVSAMNTTYEIQYGHVQRANHFNTSWDWARYEVCGHRWADISEHDLGVAVLNDSHYGWSCIDNFLRLSLLRSSKSPDPAADMGVHQFAYGYMPHKGTFQAAQVIQAAYEFNFPLLACTVPVGKSFIKISAESIIVTAVKKTENGDGILIRLYESYGGAAEAEVTTCLQFKNVFLCDILEQKLLAIQFSKSEEEFQFPITFSPFEVKSVILE